MDTENAATPMTALDEIYRRQTAVDLAIRALGPMAMDVDEVVTAAKKIDDFLAGEKVEVTFT